MLGWKKVALLLCVICAGGCANDDESQPTPIPPAVIEPKPAPDNSVYVPDDVGRLAVRPTRISVGDGYGIEGIRWKRYGGRTALGTGTLHGKPVTIRLRAKAICDGKRAYMHWAVDPEGSGKKPEFSEIMSPHTWLDACYPEPDG
jgi:hypothetical protein